MNDDMNSSRPAINDRRQEALLEWYQSCSGRRAANPRAVAGDASFRRYFRVDAEAGTLILCDAPPETEKNREFVAIASGLQALGVRVPEVIHADPGKGFLALEDLGDQTLLPLLNEASADAFYGEATRMLERLALGAMPELSDYGYPVLAREMALFPQWFCKSLLELEFDAEVQQRFAALEKTLCERALAQPRVIVHRDFHARNLMVLDDGELAAIDFQDALCGPLTYDLVSLLKDCYLKWPSDRVRQWALAHRDRLAASGVPVADAPDFLRDFDYMGLQRHIKVLGIFARLSRRDGKHGYLADLPRVLSYVRDVLAAYPDDPALAAFGSWLNNELLPAAKRQSWFRESV